MKRLHLICNAHLDPIWQWTWDEGISAALATFKSAADLAEEFDYVFCHGESLLYEAVEKNAPALFKRIQNLVKAGKWHISGGWYLQPDCLMPSGETFVRQIAVGKKYFKEKFGVEPTVATNYDSFGHSVGLVQIMAKNGYKGYIITRPKEGDGQIKYPSRFFKWTSPDGSSVLVTHSRDYNSVLGKSVEKIKNEISDEDVDYVLWGVGNHGGGPSRKDLRDIAALKIENVDEIVHSTPEALFDDEIRIGGEMKTSLITCHSGCYSSMAKVKQAFRRTENLFYATEKMISAAKLFGFDPNLKELEEAEKKMLLATFHDILPGTCIEEGEREGLGLLASSEKTLQEYRTNAFLYLVMNEPCAKEGEYPVFVFNYLPYETETNVEAEFSLADQNWSDDIRFMPRVYDETGKELPSQLIKENSMLNLDWRKRVIFTGKLKPLGITRFTIKVEPVPVTEKRARVIALEEALKDSVFFPNMPSFDLYEDTPDPWGMSREELKAMGKNPVPFRLMTETEASDYCGGNGKLAPVRIVEDGEVRTMVEALYTSGKTNVTAQYLLYKNQPYADVRLNIEFAEKNKLVRFKLPVPDGFVNGRTVGDGPFVWEEKPNCEITFQKWVGVQKNEEIFAVLNNCLYAGKVENGYIHLTLLRGVGHCFHPIGEREIYPKDRYLPRIESGRYTYNFRVYKGTVYEVSALAQAFNEPPYAVNVFPTGGEAYQGERLIVDGEVITASVIPQEEKGLIVRLYNPSYEEKPFKVSIGAKCVSAGACGGEVVSVRFDGEGFEVLHDSMPV